MDDLKVTYRPMATTPAKVEYVPKVLNWDFVDELLIIAVNPTTRIFIPVAVIQRVEVEGNGS